MRKNPGFSCDGDCGSVTSCKRAKNVRRKSDRGNVAGKKNVDRKSW